MKCSVLKDICILFPPPRDRGLRRKQEEEERLLEQEVENGCREIIFFGQISYGCCTQELTTHMMACTRPGQDRGRHSSNMAWGMAHEVPYYLRNLWQLVAVERRD